MRGPPTPQTHMVARPAILEAYPNPKGLRHLDQRTPTCSAQYRMRSRTTRGSASRQGCSRRTSRASAHAACMTPILTDRPTIPKWRASQHRWQGSAPRPDLHPQKGSPSSERRPTRAVRTAFPTVYYCRRATWAVGKGNRLKLGRAVPQLEPEAKERYIFGEACRLKAGIGPGGGCTRSSCKLPRQDSNLRPAD